MEAPVSQQISTGDYEGKESAEQGFNKTMIFSIAALAIYFIWGQGFACRWWMLLIVVALAVLTFYKKVPILQWILSAFLIGVTWFAPDTLGYTEQQKAQYNQGVQDAYLIRHGLSKDDAWEMHEEKATVDIGRYKSYYIRGLEYGLKHDK